MFATRISKTSITVLALALLVSCGKKEEPKTAAPPPTAAAAPAPQAPPAAAPATSAPTPPAAAPAAPAGPAPLATTDGEQPGLRAEVLEFKRDAGGTVVTLKFAIVNDSNETFPTNTTLGATTHGNGDYQTVSGVHLLDPVNKKKYLVIRDAEKTCACSTGLSNIAPNSRLNMWAKFPAPPPEVTKVTVVIPHFIPMDEVPIK